MIYFQSYVNTKFIIWSLQSMTIHFVLKFIFKKSFYAFFIVRLRIFQMTKWCLKNLLTESYINRTSTCPRKWAVPFGVPTPRSIRDARETGTAPEGNTASLKTHWLVPVFVAPVSIDNDYVIIIAYLLHFVSVWCNYNVRT